MTTSVGGYVGTIKRAVAVLFAAAFAAATLASPAAAETVTRTDSTAIALPATGGDSSEIVTMDFHGVEGGITDVDLTVRGIDWAMLSTLSLLLVSPNGESEVAMSSNCRDENVTNKTITLNQGAEREMPYSVNDNENCPLSEYKPSDGYPPNSYPFDGLPGAPYTHDFSSFNDENANGTWTLYALKRCENRVCKATDQIGDGWSLRITTGPIDLDVPAGSATSGKASLYPATITLPGDSRLITDLGVQIGGIYHSYADDIDMMLEGPTGQRVMLMSDACGNSRVNSQYWLWDDEAVGAMPDEQACGALTYRPTDRQVGESLPLPAPPGPYATSLSAFDLTDPSGEWKLWVNDDFAFGEGFFTQRFRIFYSARPRATVSLGPSAVEIAEGAAGELTLTRSGATSYTDGRVQVTGASGTAESGADFTPISTTVHFAPGQTEKRVPIEVLADAGGESAETFTLTVGSPSGDAGVGAPSSATVTIPADPVEPSAPGDASAPGDSGPGGSNASAPETDLDPPETTIAKAPKRKTAKRKAKIEFSSSEPGSTFECKLDKRDFGPCTSPAKVKKLRRGKHRFLVRAIDAAGNVDPTPAKAGWRVRR